jgi:alpha-glucosidase (family GH31 glycosyl hydrolase)
VNCGYAGVSQQTCESAGCCWNKLTDGSSLPWCFFSSIPAATYALSNMQQTSTGYQGTLTTSQTTGQFGAPISPLTLVIDFDTADRVRIRITDPNHARWEIPESILPTPSPANPAQKNYAVKWTNSPFSFMVVRTLDSQVIFDSSAVPLTFADQFLQIGTKLTQTDANIYGLGEHRVPLRLNNDYHIYTMWARDDPTPVDQNEYGDHPFYMELGATGSANGAFLRNSNGLDVVLQPDSLTFRAIGGVIDLFVFVGPTPTDVVQQYHAVIGLPHMPPAWSLGWQQSHYGMPSIEYVENVVANYSANNIPLDVMWSDIDYMDKYEDFSWDPVNYPASTVAQFVSKLHGNDQKYVVIVDPGIHTRVGYPAYDEGIKEKVFVMESDGVTPAVGKVWPGATVWPDFLNPNTHAYWMKQIQQFISTVPVDGLWIDMNEPSNFLYGEATSNASVNFPPYAINNFGSHAALSAKTLSVDCKHYGDVYSYNVHNLYGFTEAIATDSALESIYKKRSFVLSRSTFAGSGKYTAHWSGDNYASFDSMASSVIQMMNFNMYGVPLMGSDICGFLEDTTEELCARWMAVGCFYPFSRNHNTIGAAPQEPYRWPTVAAVARKMINARYSLHPYWYGLFYSVHKAGGTVVRPLFFEFATDSNTYAIGTQFMVGASLMVAPVLADGARSVDVYFPSSARWYSFWTLAEQTQLGTQTVSADIDDMPVYVRGGGIIPMQTPGKTLLQTRTLALSLLVALDANQAARGSLYLDDGESLDVGTESVQASFECSQSQLQSTVTQATLSGTPALSSITFVGLSTSVSSVTLSLNGGAAQPVQSFKYNPSTNSLTVSQLSINVSQPFAVTYA